VDSTIALSIALILVATLTGLCYRFFQGRGHSVSGAQCIELEKLKILKNGEEITEFGKEATVVLFPPNTVANAQRLEDRLQNWSIERVGFYLLRPT